MSGRPQGVGAVQYAEFDPAKTDPAKTDFAKADFAKAGLIPPA